MRDIVTKHYQGEGGLGDRLEAQLNSLGFDKRRLSAQDTAPLDQFHAGGLEATEKLAQLLSPSRGAYVLDVGSGLGGPSRYLATHYSCRVMGIDITEDYSRIATVLARRMELVTGTNTRKGEIVKPRRKEHDESELRQREHSTSRD